MLRIVKALQAVLMLGVFFSACIPAFADEASTVRATRVDGAVTVNGGPLKEGTVISRDDKIEAPANAAAVLSWSNGSMIEVYPGAAVVLRGVMYEADRKLEKSLITLEKGRIFVKAQVPEHLFAHFSISVGNSSLMCQGAEFGLSYNETSKEFSILSLLGTVVTEINGSKVRVDEGKQLTQGAGPAGAVAPVPEKTMASLLQTSKRLGGSLLMEEELGKAGGPLSVKIGGVRNRRGNAPYTVQFKALAGGGSGKLAKVHWQFGGGENAEGQQASHTFTQGVYVVVLTVEDANGEKASAQMNISVEEDCGC
ncbi:MAG: hypothetical protein ACD_75C00788G0003 [uncultured bacterium]|nr:MAG: hypothetical protein ACD_75C00788G0003 [uncultured bacterium]